MHLAIDTGRIRVQFCGITTLMLSTGIFLLILLFVGAVMYRKKKNLEADLHP